MRGTSNAQFGAAPLPPRARPTLFMYHRDYPITPSQQAINGALCIYVGGGKKDDARQMLFGLSVLRHATEAQINEAMPFVQASQHISRSEIQEMLAK